MTAPNSIERYLLTSCDLHRTFPSWSEASFTGSLLSPHPELLKCDPASGLSVDLDLIPLDSAETEEVQPLLLLLESQSNLTGLQQHMIERKATGFSVAAWFTPVASIPKGDIQPILTMGGKVPTSILEHLRLPHCPGYDFKIAQNTEGIVIRYTDADPDRSCRPLDVKVPFASAVPNHVVVTFDSHYTYIYINGVVYPPYSNFFDTTLQHWNMTEATMQLFTMSAAKGMFQGAIHQVHVFDQFLDETQVAAVYQEGIVSLPSAKANEADNRIRQDATDLLSISLGSWNTTSTVLKLEVELLSLPQNGVLTLGSAEVTANSHFPVPMNSSSIALNYKLKSSDYFNVPAVNASNDDLHLGSESFKFRVLTLNAKSELIATSPTVTQNVYVVHVNHPGVLSAPKEAVLGVVDPTMATVTGVDFVDPLDYNIDRVRVDIWAKNGSLSLLPAKLPLADFDSFRHRNASAWQSSGDGIRDQNMTFVAVPSFLSSILRDLGYQSLSPGTADEITIRVSDGSGVMCLDETEHAQYQDVLGNTFTSIRDDCFQTQVIVRVPGYKVKDPLNPNQKGLGGGIFGSDFGMADFLFWGMVLAILASCGCCCCRGPHSLARGKPVEVFDDNSLSENTCKETPPTATEEV